MTSTYRALLALVLCSAGITGACGDGDDPPPKFIKDASSVERPDAGPDEEPDTSPTPPDRRDAAVRDADETDAEEDLDADATDGGEETDATDMDADETDAETDGAEPDADAAEPDADAAAGDAGEDAAQTDASSGGHPLAGHYAARTVIYMRQQVDMESPLDLVSKAVLLSTVDIDAQGALREHYCFLEIVPDVGLASWMRPAAAELIPESATTLTQEAGGYARPADGTYVSWSPANQPAECTPGAPHTSGCRCYATTSIPSRPDDCRVRDLESDGTAGGALLIGAARPIDPVAETGIATLHIAATKSVGWRLPGAAAERLVGQIEGGLEQAELSRSGQYADQFGAISNSVCPASLGHVELVRGSFDCAAILAGRAADLENEDETDDALSEGLFNAQLDGTTPAPAACPEPSCGTDGDGDGSPDCQDGCPADAAKTAPGSCGCGRADTNTDGDAAPDCSDGCPNDPAKLAAGACGCGVAETNTDGDTAPDCTDECDSDPAKTAPGVCGCGVAETNTDSDAAPDCTDECDTDASKTAPGACGCGTPDTNSDSDAAPDCIDECDTDGAKTAPGTCGCGAADTDSDGDGLANCNDACPDDRAKTTLGLCGCGVADTNADSDAAPDCTDECDSDAAKTAAGACGCGVADTNSDSDAAPDCTDECDSDAAKTVAGACGCGSPETNTDGDAQPDCTDECDTDGTKTAAGACGCGNPDTNSDGDAQPDCREECDTDSNKTAPGVCGCGVPDQDLNGDQIIDCRDECPADPAKVAPGVCGCGVPDTNSDGDARLDCQEDCDQDANKTAAGQCGCGVADTDADSDGVANCNDACPNDRNKTTLGLCGCGVADTNTDGDAAPDCTDGCPADGAKTAPGTCGCGVADTDTDADGVANCNDACPNDRNKTTPGACGCGVAETNRDGDSAPDCTDQCDDDGSKTAPGACGCGVADTNRDGDSAPDCTDQCPDDATRITRGECGCSDCAPNPLVGTYAVRTVTFSKQRDGSNVLTTKSLGYSLITIAQNTGGSLSLSDRGCWAQSVPRPGDAQQAYSWSKPAWVQALPLGVHALTANSNGTYTRTIPLTHLGWDPARQPASCSASSTPQTPWPSSWGSTCRCSTPADALPPYDINAAPYDCRLVDVDGDGQPGMSAIAATSAPSSPDANAPTLGGTAYAALDGGGSWVITPAADKRHTATIEDLAEAQVVGCSGLACSFLPSSPPPTRTCPQAVNRAQFVPTTASSDTCSEIIAARSTLFDASQDPAWPDNSACPPP